MLSFAKRFVLAGALFALLLPAAVVSAEDSPEFRPETNPVVATVNGEEINLSQVQSATNELMPMVSYHQSVSDERFRSLQKKALKTIIDDLLIYDYAVKNGHDDVSRKEIKEEIKKVEERVPKGTSLKELLKNSDMTMDELREEIRQGLVVTNLRTAKKEEFKNKAEETVTDEYLRKYYDNNLEKFKEPEKIHLREILIKADPGGGQRAWIASKKKVAGLKDRILAGEDFEKVAKEFSEDVYAENGGDMGWAHAGSMDPGIEEVAKSLEIGEIGGPVMSIYGYHIIKLEGRKPPVQKNFEDLNLEGLRNEFRSKLYKDYWSGWMDELREGADIVYLYDRFKVDDKK